MATHTKIATANAPATAERRFSACAGSAPVSAERDVPDRVVERVGLTRRQIRFANSRLKGGGIAEIKAGQEGGAVQQERDRPGNGTDREARADGGNVRECWAGLGRVRTRGGRHARNSPCRAGRVSSEALLQRAH